MSPVPLDDTSQDRKNRSTSLPKQYEEGYYYVVGAWRRFVRSRGCAWSVSDSWADVAV